MRKFTEYEMSILKHVFPKAKKSELDEYRLKITIQARARTSVTCEYKLEITPGEGRVIHATVTGVWPVKTDEGLRRVSDYTLIDKDIKYMSVDEIAKHINPFNAKTGEVNLDNAVYHLANTLIEYSKAIGSIYYDLADGDADDIRDFIM